jgi:pyruvate dehydrogenase E2 component (dihydrolipoamide acetyltransferase)
MVPVIKDADKKGVLQISQEMGELAKKARDGKLSPAEMSGASFTISSAWAALAGVTSRPSSMRPRWPSWACARARWSRCGTASLCAAPDAAAVLTWDHRVIDGAAAARFNAYLGQILGDFRRVLLYAMTTVVWYARRARWPSPPTRW